MSGHIAEIAPGYFALSQLIDPREHSVTWLPPGATGYDPANIYLVRGRDAALVIDTGFAAFREGYLGQLREMVDGMPLRMIFSRSEPDCLGNLGPIVEEFRISEFNYNSPIHPLDYAGTLEERFMGIATNDHVRLGTWVAMDGADRFLIVDPAVRTLSTMWIYDAETQVLFSSDFYGHQQTNERWEIEQPATPERIAAWMTSKFDWLRAADTRVLAARLKAIHAEHTVSAIAPTHGRWIVGASAVNVALAQTVDALELIATARALH